MKKKKKKKKEVEHLVITYTQAISTLKLGGGGSDLLHSFTLQGP